MTPDWAAIELMLEQDANMRQVAKDIRAEANMFKDAYYEAKRNGAPAEDVKALGISMWQLTEKAAQVERALRDIR